MSAALVLWQFPLLPFNADKRASTAIQAFTNFFANYCPPRYVQYNMSSLNTNERTQFAALQDDYRRAWHAFTIEVESLRSALNSTPVDEDLIQEARRNVEISASAYREARNALAVRLLDNDSHTREIDHDIAVVLDMSLQTA